MSPKRKPRESAIIIKIDSAPAAIPRGWRVTIEGEGFYPDARTCKQEVSKALKGFVKEIPGAKVAYVNTLRGEHKIGKAGAHKARAIRPKDRSPDDVQP